MPTLKIKVDYYNNDEKENIKKNFPNDFDLIEAVAGKTIEIPYEDFKVYSVFRYQYETLGYRTFDELSSIAQGIQEFEHILKYDPEIKSLVKAIPERSFPSYVSETIGVAGGLTVGSTIYQLTQADWQQINITKNKDFDFKRTAATSNKYINLELKGCIVEDNSKKDEAVSRHKLSIHNKKEDPNFQIKYDYATDTCLGIIVVADSSKELQAWLVDPEFDRPNMYPNIFKLFKRIFYYYNLLHSISPRSTIITALANKYKIMERLTEFDFINSVPLVNQNLEPILISESFFNTRTSNDNKTIVGKLSVINNILVFIGIQVRFIEMIVRQNYSEIISFSLSPSTLRVALNCVINKRYQDSLNTLLRSERITNLREENNNLLFRMNMNIETTSSGMCFSYIHL